MDEPTAAPEAAAPEAPVEAPSAEPTTVEADPYEGWDIDKFKTEHAKLKAENVSKKERFRPIEQAFDGADPAEVQQYLTFVSHLRSGDQNRVKAATKWMRENLDLIDPQVAEAVQDAADAASQQAGGDSDFDPFDPEAIAKLVDERAAKMLDEREQARQQREAEERSISEMNEYAAKLGKDMKIPGFGDPNSPEFLLLFRTANQLDANMPWQERLKAAAEKTQGWIAEQAQNYLKAKTAEAAAPAAPPEGGAPSGSTTPATFKDARASANERLKKLTQPAGTP